MARQNSKYFSSVIEKLIADKHKENIVVDESFKMSLRGKVMERAAMMPRVEVLDGAEISGFAGFVNKWKYALALVPSALLVMVVASQVMNLPVAVESDVVVEGGGALTSEQNEAGTSVLQSEEQEEALTLEDLRISEVENNSAGGVGTSEAENSNVGGQTKKIKTFPGALVMPVGGLTSGQNATRTSVLQSGEQSATDTLKELRTFKVDTNNVGEMSTSEVETSDVGAGVTFEVDINNDGVVYSPVYVPDRTGSLGGDVQFEFSYRVTTYEDTERVVKNDKSLVVADKGDSVVVAQNGDVAVGDGVGGGVDEQATVYATRDLVVPSLAVPMELSAYNLTYETSLSGTEKAALETNAILPLTEGRDVQRVVVGRDANEYVSVTVFYGDGSTVTSTFSFNSELGVWDKVTYIQPVSQQSANLRIRRIR